MLGFLFFSLIIGLIGASIWADYTLDCPDCSSRLKSSGVHVHIASTSTVWICESCEKEWI